jgi:adenylate cyclase
MVKRLQDRQLHDQARKEMEKALELGPDSWEVNKEAGRFYLLQRDVPTATRCYEKVVELMDTDFHAWAMLSSCYLALGDKKKKLDAARMMVSEAERAVQQDPSNGAALGILAGGHALLGDEERAREWISRALLVDPENLTMRYTFACVLVTHLDDKDGALKMLETTLALAGAPLVRIADTDTDLDSIRDDTRFQKMIAGAKTRLRLVDPEPVQAVQAAE